MKKVVIVPIILALAGCSSLGLDPAKFENRAVCTLAKDKAFVVSEYGPIGVSSVISDKDRAVICK